MWKVKDESMSNIEEGEEKISWFEGQSLIEKNGQS